MCISILMKPSNISCCSSAFSNHSASLPWLDNVASQHHSPSTKVKGAIVDGPFLSGRKSLAAIPMGSKPGSISFTKIWSKVVDEVVQNQQKKHSFTGPKAQEASSIFFCVCVSVFLGKKWGMWMKNQLYQSEFRTFLQPKRIFLSISILCEVSKKSEIFVETVRYGLKWGH